MSLVKCKCAAGLFFKSGRVRMANELTYFQLQQMLNKD